MEYKIAEKFVSINGEGPKAGQLALFIRFCGCGLNCVWCDTRWANLQDVQHEVMTERDICEYINSSEIKNVVLTGGEPLIQAGIIPLIQKLIEETDAFCEIETNGAADISPVPRSFGRVSVTMDYKLPGSGMEEFMLKENFEYIIKNDAVKFVTSDKTDLERAYEIIMGFDLASKCAVFLSPVFGRINPAEIVDFMKDKKQNGVNFQLQLHKYIWGPDARGV